MTNQNRPPKDGAPLSDEEEPAATVDLTAADMAADEAGESAREDTETALRAEVSELSDRILRLAAELENTRRRGEREKAEAGRYAISNFARDLLSIVDAFQRALAAAPAPGAEISADTVAALVEGLRMTDRELLTVLERYGVRRIDPKGEKFDPNLHQAVAQIPGRQPAGFVEEVAQPGFTIGDRVLRAAMVLVSSGAAPAAVAEDAATEPRLDRRI